MTNTDSPRHIRPEKLSAREVFDLLGRHWTCPYCQAETTRALPEADLGWVKTPLRQEPPQFICLGCCEDVYSTCASEEFSEHPYVKIVNDAAAREGISPFRFRRICLLHQIRAGEERAAMGQQSVEERIAYLKSLLKVT